MIYKAPKSEWTESDREDIQKDLEDCAMELRICKVLASLLPWLGTYGKRNLWGQPAIPAGNENYNSCVKMSTYASCVLCVIQQRRRSSTPAESSSLKSECVHNWRNGRKFLKLRSWNRWRTTENSDEFQASSTVTIIIITRISSVERGSVPLLHVTLCCYDVSAWRHSVVNRCAS